MSKNPQNLINVKGVTLDANVIDLPTGARLFREAWQVEDGAVTINMKQARRMRSKQLVQEAVDRADELDREAMTLEFEGEDGNAKAVEAAKFRGKPKRSVVRVALRDAKTLEELSAIKVEDLF